MYEISSALYSEVADRLRGYIDGKGYYSGSFEFDFEGIHCLMRLSGVIYRTRETIFGNQTHCIEDMVPVWWEFHTFNEEGVELLNEFSFNILREHLKEI